MRIIEYSMDNICKFTQCCIRIYMYTLVFVILLCIDEKMNEGVLEKCIRWWIRNVFYPLRKYPTSSSEPFANRF